MWQTVFYNYGQYVFKNYDIALQPLHVNKIIFICINYILTIYSVIFFQSQPNILNFQVSTTVIKRKSKTSRVPTNY